MRDEFTLILNREITDDESRALQEAGCSSATLTTTSLPTNADVVVTQMDFDTESTSLAETLTSALEALKIVPDLSAACLTVPPQPSGAPAGDADQAAGDAPAMEETAAPADGADGKGRRLMGRRRRRRAPGAAKGTVRLRFRAGERQPGRRETG